MHALDPVAAHAVSLAASAGPGDQAKAVADLASADHADLVKAQKDLVERIQLRSDDYQATAALRLVNKALAQAGWSDPFSWKHRRKP